MSLVVSLTTYCIAFGVSGIAEMHDELYYIVYNCDPVSAVYIFVT